MIDPTENTEDAGASWNASASELPSPTTTAVDPIPVLTDIDLNAPLPTDPAPITGVTGEPGTPLTSSDAEAAFIAQEQRTPGIVEQLNILPDAPQIPDALRHDAPIAHPALTHLAELEQLAIFWGGEVGTKIRDLACKVRDLL